jgi:hypothetical protein
MRFWMRPFGQVDPFTRLSPLRLLFFGLVIGAGALVTTGTLRAALVLAGASCMYLALAEAILPTVLRLVFEGTIKHLGLRLYRGLMDDFSHLNRMRYENAKARNAPGGGSLPDGTGRTASDRIRIGW